MVSVKHSEFFGYQNSLLSFSLHSDLDWRVGFIRIKWMCISGRKEHFLWSWQMPLDSTSFRPRGIWEECDIFPYISFLLFEARFLESVACSYTGMIFLLSVIIDILGHTLAPNIWEFPELNVYTESGICSCWKWEIGYRCIQSLLRFRHYS